MFVSFFFILFLPPSGEIRISTSGPRQKILMSARARTSAPVKATAFPAPSDHESSTYSNLSRDQRHDLLTRFFAHHDRPTDSPDQRAAALGAWLDAAVAAVPTARPDDIAIAATHDTPSNRRKLVRVVTAVPDIGLVSRLVEVLLPSGRFDALVDMGNPMKGVILFPYLQRRIEGRALRAMAPAESLELCRTVAESVVPRRWLREVRYQKLGMFDAIDCVDRCVEICPDSCKAYGIAAWVRRAPNPANSAGRMAWP
jgi:hypothetical protein